MPSRSHACATIARHSARSASRRAPHASSGVSGPCGISGRGSIGERLRRPARPRPATSLVGTGRSSTGKSGLPGLAIEHEQLARLGRLRDRRHLAAVARARRPAPAARRGRSPTGRDARSGTTTRSSPVDAAQRHHRVGVRDCRPDAGRRRNRGSGCRSARTRGRARRRRRSPTRRWPAPVRRPAGRRAGCQRQRCAPVRASKARTTPLPVSACQLSPIDEPMITRSPIDRRRRRHLVVGRCRRCPTPAARSHVPAGAEAGARPAGARVERDEPRVDGADEDPPRARRRRIGRRVAPGRHAARGHLASSAARGRRRRRSARARAPVAGSSAITRPKAVAEIEAAVEVDRAWPRR